MEMTGMETKQNDVQKERLEQQIRFIIEVDKVKNIFRQTYLADGQRKENDAEHSWHLALSAVLLKEHMKEDVDLAKVMVMVLRLMRGILMRTIRQEQRQRESGK